MSKSHLLKASGNRCGHDPLCPRLRSVSTPVTDARLTLPVINSIRKWLEACFSSPPECPLFNHQPNLRRVRSERREAYLLVLLTLLRHFDSASLCLGFRLSNGQFRPLRTSHITLEAGLGCRRCGRALSDLKQAGALEMRVPTAGINPVLAFNADFIEWLLWEASIWEMSQNQAKKSVSRPSWGDHESD